MSDVLRIFAISVWGYGGDWLCCLVHQPQARWRFSKVMWRFLIYTIVPRNMYPELYFYVLISFHRYFWLS